MIVHSRRRSRSSSQLSARWVRAGRLLLIINVVVLILSSFTEHFWAWDRFLRGGQDFELSLLALIAFFCLILVLAAHLRRAVRDRLAHHPGHPLTCDAGGLLLPPSPLLFVPPFWRPPGGISADALSSVILRI